MEKPAKKMEVEDMKMEMEKDEGSETWTDDDDGCLLDRLVSRNIYPNWARMINLDEIDGDEINNRNAIRIVAKAYGVDAFVALARAIAEEAMRMTMRMTMIWIMKTTTTMMRMRTCRMMLHQYLLAIVTSRASSHIIGRFSEPKSFEKEGGGYLILHSCIFRLCIERLFV